jgi:hypothetical protein
MRIEVSSSSSGPSNFVFKINPHNYDAQDSPQIEKLEVLHGSQIHQGKAIDDRVRVLTWDNIHLEDSNISNIVSYFRSTKGKIRYFNFNTLDPMNTRWPSSNIWKKARVINLDIDYSPGGKLQYAYIKLYIQPEL